MPEKSYAKATKPDGSGWRQVAMLLLNAIPLIHLSLTLLILFASHASLPFRIVNAILCVYIIPPILARFVVITLRKKGPYYTTDSNQFLLWWLSLQLQMLFNRLPFLEEILRFIPGAYSTWLRLWGSRIGKFTYWSPGVRILDRSFLDVGDNVVFGAGVRLNPHVIDRTENGVSQLALATIQIGSETLVGGYSLLTAGTQIESGETVRAFRVSPPFSHWKNGKRITQ
jgi:acetyltransferase-like isoleucine patch superfamily enzyme